ncbi:hypothetical protein SOASR031_15270 [Leminorella grimontii]|nr:hypothetical protein SOASR031_15270 [Leminorella grimontii]
MATLSQNHVIKAERAGHSGPMPKCDNAEFVILARVPKGWGHFYAALRSSWLIWPAKPRALFCVKMTASAIRV